MIQTRLFAVSFDPDRWVTPEQAASLERVLLRWVGPEQSDALARALDRWESICLDAALLGMVIAHESGDYHNQLYWAASGPTAKTDAGWPEGLWLPPSRLDGGARDVLRARLLPGQDASRAIEWANWQLSSWWDFAAAFEVGANVSSVRPDSSLGFTVTASASRASPHQVGEIMHEPPTADRPQCAATWPRHVVSDAGHHIQSRQCPFPADRGELICKVHAAVGAL